MSHLLQILGQKILLTKIILLIFTTSQDQVICATADAINDVDTKRILEDYANDISVESCWKNYPYTYSKCLNLCDVNFDPICMDDQLCICNNALIRNLELIRNVRMENATLNANVGASRNATCLYSDFCEDLCQKDEKLKSILDKHKQGQLLKIDGAFCTISGTDFDQEISSCICSINAQF